MVTPFLPGDSLLFALGALCATENATLKLPWVGITLVSAAILGDAINYFIGWKIGPKIFRSETGRWLNQKHLESTQAFFEKHGGKTILLARFVPIARTFAPFVAGIGKMRYGRFALFNVSGGIVWVLLFLLLGYYFGNIPAVKRNFELVILAIILISFIPVFMGFKNNQRGWGP